jgi:hypothetical protein
MMIINTTDMWLFWRNWKKKKKNLMINEIDNKEMRELVCLWYELVVIMIWRILGDGETIIIKEWGRSVYHVEKWSKEIEWLCLV